ncbi:hypothetical protein ACFX2A_009151 [Malus domestica]
MLMWLNRDHRNRRMMGSRGGSTKGPRWSQDHPKLGKMAVRIFKDHPSLAVMEKNSSHGCSGRWAFQNEEEESKFFF